MPKKLRAVHDHNSEVLERIYIGRRDPQRHKTTGKTVRDVYKEDQESERMTHPIEPLVLNKIVYKELNSRQQETYNFHRVAARLAEYGYNSILLSDDWLGADFIAYHIDGERFYRVQLKGRMMIDDKYTGKGLYIAFIDGDRVYLYPHDELAQQIDTAGRVNGSVSWSEKRKYSWPRLPSWVRELLAEFEVK